MSRFVSECCQGETCFCGQPAEHKVEETIFHDEPIAVVGPNGKPVISRHPQTAYICHDHFKQIMGSPTR